MEHTQGNWNVGTAAGGSVCVRENGRCNAEIAIICTAEGRTVKEVKANAKLIAAAPELLAACEEAKELIRVARRYFPKAIKNSDKFTLENTCASIGKAVDKATA